MVKWAGMYLSEHTETINKDKSRRGRIVKERPEMFEIEIREILNISIVKNQQVSVQSRERDLDGNLLDNVEGFVIGFDEDFLYIGDKKILYNSIRNVQLNYFRKWNNVK